MTQMMTDTPPDSANAHDNAATVMPGSRKKSALLILVIVATVVLTLLVLKAMKPEPPVAKKVEKAWGVDTLTATPERLSPQLRLLAVVESPATSALKSALSADVLKVIADEGQHVAQGDLLVQLDDQEARINLAQREADVADIEAQVAMEHQSHAQNLTSLKNEEALVDLAERAVSRESSLKKSNVSSAANMDQARRTLEQQQLSLQTRKLAITNHTNRLAQLTARLIRAKALRDLAQLDLDRARITAPFDGVITQVQASAGERVRVGDPLVTLYDVHRVEVRAQIPEVAMKGVADALVKGQKILASTTAFGQEVSLILDRLSGEVNSGRGGIDALFTLTNSAQSASPRLVLGHTIDVLFNLPEVDNVIAVPVSALYGTDRVYQVAEGRLKSATVERTGTRYDGNRQWLLIKSKDLEPGAKIITTQLPAAVNGLKVTLREATQTP